MESAGKIAAERRNVYSRERTRSLLPNREKCRAFLSVRESKTIRGFDLYKHFVPPVLLRFTLILYRRQVWFVVCEAENNSGVSNCGRFAACETRIHRPYHTEVSATDQMNTTDCELGMSKRLRQLRQASMSSMRTM